MPVDHTKIAYIGNRNLEGEDIPLMLDCTPPPPLKVVLMLIIITSSKASSSTLKFVNYKISVGAMSQTSLETMVFDHMSRPKILYNPCIHMYQLILILVHVQSLEEQHWYCWCSGFGRRSPALYYHSKARVSDLILCGNNYSAWTWL